MKKFEHETIIINKEAWKFMWNFERKLGGFKPCTDAYLNKIWSKMCFRNRGANPATHPIADDEIRLDRDSFRMNIKNLKHTLADNGYEFRQDGFIAEGFYL